MAPSEVVPGQDIGGHNLRRRSKLKTTTTTLPKSPSKANTAKKRITTTKAAGKPKAAGVKKNTPTKKKATTPKKAGSGKRGRPAGGVKKVSSTTKKAPAKKTSIASSSSAAAKKRESSLVEMAQDMLSNGMKVVRKATTPGTGRSRSLSPTKASGSPGKPKKNISTPF